MLTVAVLPETAFPIGQAYFSFERAFKSPKSVMEKETLSAPDQCPAPPPDVMAMRIELSAAKTPILEEYLYQGILDALFNKDKEFSLIRLLSNPNSKVAASDTTEMAKLIVELAESQERAVPLLTKLIEDEVEGTPSTAVLFRANTIACKAVDDYIRLIAMPWTNCLIPGAKFICENDLVCEIDKDKLDKMKEHTDPEDNILNLHTMLGPQVAAILDGAGQCPLNMRILFNRMRAASVKRFPDDGKVAWTSISGLVFLRFFVPALRTPVTFGLVETLPSTNAERNFLIVASVLQKLANIKVYDTDQHYWHKLNNWIGMNTRVLKEFVDSISLARYPQPPDVVFPVPEIDISGNGGLLLPYLLKYRGLFEAEKESNPMARFLLSELDRVDMITKAIVDLYEDEPHSVRVMVSPRNNPIEPKTKAHGVEVPAFSFFLSPFSLSLYLMH